MSMSILVTGGSGFLGSSIALKLISLGHEVSLLLRTTSCLDRLGDYPSEFNISYASTFSDIQDFVRNVRPKFIIHTACSYGRHGESFLEISDANYRFGLVIMQALISMDYSMSFINTGTSLDPKVSFYALTKYNFSQIGHLLAATPISKVRFINVQLEHMYGPGDDKRKFTSNVIQACSNNHHKLDLTVGTQKRDFIYIDDVVSAYEAILNKADTLKASANIEVGSGSAPSVKNFVETVHRLTGSLTKLNFGALPLRPHEPMLSQANISQMQLLGWVPKFDLEAGLKKTIELELQKSN